MEKTLSILAIAFAINTNAQIITTIAGTGGGGYTGDGGPATAAGLFGPSGITFDAVGNLYISDYNNYRIRKVNTNGVISTFAGGGSCGSNYCGDGGQATAAGIKLPNGIALDVTGNLYIVDNGNFVIRKVNTAGIITTYAGGGSSSGNGIQATAAALANPMGAACDAAGNLYIADYGANEIFKVTPSGIITTFAGNGTRAYAGDGGPATAASLDAPTDVACDAAGNLYISDFSRGGSVRKVDLSGTITLIAGTGSCGSLYCGDGGPATAAEMYNPYGLTVDAVGNIYIADTENNRIRMVNTVGIIYTIAGNGTRSYSGDGGQATAAELNYPSSVSIDAAGNLYICDTGNNAIRKVTNSSAAGIEQFANNNEQVSIYPNPSNGLFNLSISQFDNSTTNRIEIHNLMGECVYRQIATSVNCQIDVSDLSEGVYNISIENSQFTNNKRLVITK
jgi:sugar lactone lactonase YvrE